MLGNAYFFNGLLRIYIAVFGKMFDDLRVQRKDSSGNTIQELPVPLSYGPKEKWVRRITEDPNMLQQLQYQLPRMTYEMLGLTHVLDQQTSPLQRFTNVPTSEEMFWQLKYTTYNLTFALHIQTKNDMDMFNIIEQVLPFFTPDMNLKVRTVPVMDYADNVIIVLDSVAIDHEYAGSLDDKRTVTATLQFTMTARFYGPVHQQSPIKRVWVDLLIPPGSNPVTSQDISTTPRSVRITVTPGETANGQPTSNSALSKPWNEISASDVTMDGQQAWAYITSIVEFQDGLKFDPYTLTDVPVAEVPPAAEPIQTEE